MLGRVVEERHQDVEVVGDLRGGLGPLGAVLGGERFRGDGVVPSSAWWISARAVSRRDGPLSAAPPTRCRLYGTISVVRRWWGTRRGRLSRSPAPSPTTRTGARMPRRLQSRNRSAHDSDDSRYPSDRALNSLRPSARTPIMTSRQMLSVSRRTFTWMPSTHPPRQDCADWPRSRRGLPRSGRLIRRQVHRLGRGPTSRRSATQTCHHHCQRGPREQPQVSPHDGHVSNGVDPIGRYWQVWLPVRTTTRATFAQSTRPDGPPPICAVRTSVTVFGPES